jgi:addiction module RelE/StbE family toxin
MRTLIWSKASVRTFKRTVKKHPSVRKHIEETLETLEKNPFAPRLATHKLKGKLAGLWACSAGYDLRIVFDFVESGKQKEDDIFLLEIGTHEEVY